MRRLLTIIYILFCLELGIFLFILPWASYWSKNYFVNHYPVVSSISRNYFLRGAVSGLGLADIWLALHEIWQLLHSPRTSDSRISK
jgi:hypothetical protein